MSVAGKTGISAHSLHALHYIWGYIGFIAETLIFMFAGVIMGGLLREDIENKFLVMEKDIPLIFVCYIVLHIIRFFSIMLFFPCLSRMGYGLDIKQAIMIGYGGLRGAVGLCLALIVHNEQRIPGRVRGVTLFYTSMIALLTLVINAPTTGFVVRCLGLTKESDL